MTDFHPRSAPGGSGESSASGESSDSTGTSTETGPECVSDDDCGPGYACEGGMCEYWGYQDGSIWYDCYSDEDCPEFEYCEVLPGADGGYCTPLGQRSIG